jgi:hypothetical protein
LPGACVTYMFLICQQAFESRGNQLLLPKKVSDKTISKIDSFDPAFHAVFLCSIMPKDAQDIACLSRCDAGMFRMIISRPATHSHLGAKAIEPRKRWMCKFRTCICRDLQADGGSALRFPAIPLRLKPYFEGTSSSREAMTTVSCQLDIRIRHASPTGISNLRLSRPKQIFGVCMPTEAVDTQGVDVMEPAPAAPPPKVPMQPLKNPMSKLCWQKSTLIIAYSHPCKAFWGVERHFGLHDKQFAVCFAGDGAPEAEQRCNSSPPVTYVLGRKDAHLAPGIRRRGSDEAFSRSK